MRLIDADEFIERIKPYNTDDYADKALYNFAFNHIICCPTVQAISQGHWIHDRNRNNVRCSVCGRGYKDVCCTSSIVSYNYCPNCGCRMFEPQESEDKE